MLYELGRRHANNRQTIGVTAARAILANNDADTDYALSYSELIECDVKRAAMLVGSVVDVMRSSGWIMTQGQAAVDNAGAGLAAVPTPTCPSTGCPVDDGLVSKNREFGIKNEEFCVKKREIAY